MSTLNISSAQSNTNFYLLNNDFVFECIPFNVSYNLPIQPSFLNYDDVSTKGFTDASQVATLDISSNVINNMFLFGNKTNFNVSELDDLQYGIQNNNYNISFSQANVSTIFTKTTLPIDYIKAICKDITNTDQMIFKNVSTVISGIQFLDARLNIQLKHNISQNIIDNGLLQDGNSIQNIYAYSCKQLIAGILTYTSAERQSQFFHDISIQTSPYSISFYPGDKLGMKINYVPKNGNGTVLPGLETTTFPNRNLYTRSYKIILNVV